MFDENSAVAGLLLKPQALTTTTQGPTLDCKDYVGIGKVILNTAKSSAGTSPTMNVKVQDSADDSSYADVSGATFTQVTDSVDLLQSIALDMDKVRRYVQITATIGGTNSPSFVCGVVLVGKKQVST